ncbi:MAG: Fe-S cluster assembly protein SufD, partial [Pseudomonadota bacterium]
MNAIADQKSALAEALLAEGAVADPASEAPWAQRFRAAAVERVRALGAPVRRDEYWKYTDPSSLTRPVPLAPASAAAPPRRGPFAAIEAVTLTFVNGLFRPDLSDPLALEGVEIVPLSQAL